MEAAATDSEECLSTEPSEISPDADDSNKPFQSPARVGYREAKRNGVLSHHFVFSQEQSKSGRHSATVCCKTCGDVLAYNGNSSLALKHIRTHDLNPQITPYFEGPLLEQFIKAAASTSTPLSAFQHPSWQSFFKMLKTNSEYILPSPIRTPNSDTPSPSNTSSNMSPSPNSPNRLSPSSRGRGRGRGKRKASAPADLPAETEAERTPPTGVSPAASVVAPTSSPYPSSSQYSTGLSLQALAGSSSLSPRSLVGATGPAVPGINDELYRDLLNAHSCSIQLDQWESHGNQVLGVQLRYTNGEGYLKSYLLNLELLPFGRTQASGPEVSAVLESCLQSAYVAELVRRTCAIGVPFVVNAAATAENEQAVARMAAQRGLPMVLLPCAAHICTHATQAALQMVPKAEVFVALCEEVIAEIRGDFELHTEISKRASGSELLAGQAFQKQPLHGRWGSTYMMMAHLAKHWDAISAVMAQWAMPDGEAGAKEGEAAPPSKDPLATARTFFCEEGHENKEVLEEYVQILEMPFRVVARLQSEWGGMLCSLPVLLERTIEDLKAYIEEMIPALKGRPLTAARLEEELQVEGVCPQWFLGPVGLAAALVFQLRFCFFSKLMPQTRGLVPPLAEFVSAKDAHSAAASHALRRPGRVPAEGPRKLALFAAAMPELCDPYYDLEIPSADVFVHKERVWMVAAVARLAAVLDPRCKRGQLEDRAVLEDMMLNVLSSPEEEDAAVDGGEGGGDAMAVEDHETLFGSRLQKSRTKRRKLSAVLAARRDIAIREVRRYMTMEPEYDPAIGRPNELVPYEWWQAQKYQFPSLAPFALYMTSLSSNTTSVEALFTRMRTHRGYSTLGPFKEDSLPKAASLELK